MTQRIDSVGPGAVVLVKKGNEILYHKAFGKADIEMGTDMEIDHIFDLASITKEFTAIAILQLEAQGLFSITDDVHHFLPGYPTQGQIITIEHLLTHTSGIRNHMDMDWASGPVRLEFDSILAVIRHFKTDTLIFIPGEKYEYCNTGFQILGHIIEKVSRLSFADYLDQNMFELSGMTNSTYPRNASEVKKISTGYESKDGEIILAREHSLTQNCGQSGLHSTALDLSRWYTALNSFKIVPEADLKRAWTTSTLNDGRPTNYGLGWNIENKFGSPTISHTGFMFGHSSTDLYFPNDSLLVIVLSNVGAIEVVNTNEIAFDISTYFYEDRIIEMTKEELDRFVGVYQMDPGFDVKVHREDMQLYVKVDSNRPDKVVAVASNRFKVKDFDADVEFELDENGVYSKITLSRAEMRFKGERKTIVE